MGFFASVWASISDPGAYPELIRKTTGKSIVYLVLLVLLFGTPVLVQLAWTYNQGVDTLITAAEKDVPDFTFANGELDVKGDMPIKVEGDQGSIIVIDTTGSTDASILDDYPSGVFISRYQLVNKESGLKTETMEFRELRQFSFDKQEVMSWIPALKILWVFLLLGGWAFMLAAKLFALLIISLLTLLLGSIQKISLNFDQSLRITAHALTAPIIFQACKDLVYDQLPLAGLIYYGMLLVYLWLAIKAVKKAAETVPPEV